MAALIIKHLVAGGRGTVLAVDADPNSTLPEALGCRSAASIVGTIEEISKNMDAIPSGMTKDRYIEMRVQEALGEEKDFDLLVMGRPEGPGCYCYVNNLLREMIGRVTKNYGFVVVDNAAGMEHISRRTMRSLDRLVLVSDYSLIGVRSAKRIYDLAKELGIKVAEAFLIINKAAGTTDALRPEIDSSGLKVAGAIPYNETLADLSLSGRPIFEFEDEEMKKSMEKIMKVIS